MKTLFTAPVRTTVKLTALFAATAFFAGCGPGSMIFGEGGDKSVTGSAGGAAQARAKSMGTGKNGPETEDYTPPSNEYTPPSNEYTPPTDTSGWS
ncbi:hypothetical protein SAMN05877809_103308 [Rhodobacter sp. JA431]|nr:hypothetical protein SAMN05877809_103308 [Rhodobacter sp. JA431]